MKRSQGLRSLRKRVNQREREKIKREKLRDLGQWRGKETTVITNQVMIAREVIINQTENTRNLVPDTESR